jgi:hypothetical protein
MSGLLMDGVQKYGVSIPQDYTRTFDVLNQSINQSNNIRTGVLGSDATSSDSATAIIQQSSMAITTSFAGIDLVKSMLLDMGDVIGIPAWFIGGLICLLIIVLGYLALTYLSKQYHKI